MTRSVLLLALLLAAPAWAQSSALGVFVGNQGAPASVTYIDPSGEMAEQLLDGQLGGYLQGLAVIDGQVYVTGNGDRIDVLDAATGARVAQIQDDAFTTARYIAAVGEGRAYVTTQTYDPAATTIDVVILDTETNTVAGRIALPVTSDGGLVYGNAEGLAVVGGKAYVSQAAFGQGDAIAVIDTATDEVVASIATGCTARYPLADDDGDVVVPCAGGTEILVIDSETDAIAQRVAVEGVPSLGTGFAQDAVVATVGGAETVFVVVPDVGLLPFDPDAYTVGDVVAVPEIGTRAVTALGVDEARERLYLGRPDPDAPFSADGTVTVHDLSGTLVATYDAGIYPSYVAVFEAGGVAAEPGAATHGLRLALAGAHPVRQRTALALSLDRAADVRVEAFDLLGRPVATLAAGARAAGEHRVDVDASVLPAGVYLVRATAGGRTATLPLTVAR